MPAFFQRFGDNEVVRVAIIVPVYRQSGLLVEALDTALAQDTDFAYAIVVVNDGCPSDETDRVCREFASAHPQRIYYLRKRNGGLSAARNSGIDFALAAFPELEGVYFLDADNRMQPRLLQRLCDVLQRAGPDIGWAYPDVDKFGFSEFCDTSGPYSPLEHLFRNFCEAGSLVSRRMLDAGLRFDETMLQGSEDWEFWLQGLELGFRGVHVSGAGFRYRRRGESMLVKSERNYRPILEHIRTRHSRLFDVRALMRLEAAMSCRYAVYFPDRDIVSCITDPEDGGEHISKESFTRRLLRASERPEYGRCPGHVVVMDTVLFDYLRAHRLLKAALWTFERMMLQATLVTCSVTFGVTSGERAAAWQSKVSPIGVVIAGVTADAAVHIAAVHAQTLAASARTEVSAPLKFGHEPSKPFHEVRLDLQLRIPGDPPQARSDASGALFRLYEIVAHTWGRGEYGGWRAAQIDRYRCGVAMPCDLYRGVCDLPSVMPVRPGGSARQVALVVDPPRSAAILPALAPFTAYLRDRGWNIHLVGLGWGTLSWPGDTEHLLASIVPFPLSLTTSERATTRREAYLGTPITRIAGDDYAAAVGTLAGFDLVISAENTAAHTLTARLGDLRIETWALLGIADDTAQTAEAVNACAAFEYAYQTIVVLNVHALRLCRALGLPPEKLWRWSEDDGGDADDWRRCPRLLSATAAIRGIAIE